MAKKYHLKNDKVEHVLPYHFLNDKNHTQIVSPMRKKLIPPHALKHGMFYLHKNGNSFCCTYICVYSNEKMFAGIEPCIFVFVLAILS